MCFDPRKASADTLVKAWQGRMMSRDENLLNWDDADRMKRENEALIALRHAPSVSPPRDGPRGGTSDDLISRATLANCARGHDGFAGSILAAMAERRAHQERIDGYERDYHEWIATRDGPLTPAAKGTLVLIVVACIATVAIALATTPSPTTGGHRAATSPSPSAPGRPAK